LDFHARRDVRYAEVPAVTRMVSTTALRLRVAVLLILGLLTGPLAADAQPAGKVPRVGFLVPAPDSPQEKEFRDGLRDLGYIEGQNILIEYRATGGRDDAAPAYMAEFVRLKVDIIVTWTTPAALAAKRATSRIPIVAMTGDPVGTGLVASLAKPGGNVTGVSIVTDELDAKQLELLREAVPRLARVGVLANVANPVWAVGFDKLQALASRLGLTLRLVEVSSERELARAFADVVRERAGALLVLRDNLFIIHRQRIVDLAEKHRLPAMYGSRPFVEVGGLMALGVNPSGLMWRLATYVDRIIKGANPADLPIEQPIKFELVINLKTAKALGLTIPPSLLIRADQVIE
jgi:putative ABC transport system substrate-binding protein